MAFDQSVNPVDRKVGIPSIKVEELPPISPSPPVSPTYELRPDTAVFNRTDPSVGIWLYA